MDRSISPSMVPKDIIVVAVSVALLEGFCGSSGGGSDSVYLSILSQVLAYTAWDLVSRLLYKATKPMIVSGLLWTAITRLFCS